LFRVAAAVVAVIAAFVGVMFLRFSGDSAEPVVCGPSTPGPVGNVMGTLNSESGVISYTLATIHNADICNQPDSSTAKATLTTWAKARETITRASYPSRGQVFIGVLDDAAPVWLVEVRGNFVPLRSRFRPDVPSPTPTKGTWLSIASDVNGICCPYYVVPDRR
jgi:hypothetical protein